MMMLGVEVLQVLPVRPLRRDVIRANLESRLLGSRADLFVERHAGCRESCSVSSSPPSCTFMDHINGAAAVEGTCAEKQRRSLDSKLWRGFRWPISRPISWPYGTFVPGCPPWTRKLIMFAVFEQSPTDILFLESRVAWMDTMPALT